MLTIEFLVALTDNTWYLTEVETDNEELAEQPYEKIVEWAIGGPLKGLREEESVTLIAIHHLFVEEGSIKSCKSFAYGNSDNEDEADE